VQLVPTVVQQLRRFRLNLRVAPAIAELLVTGIFNLSSSIIHFVDDVVFANNGHVRRKLGVRAQWLIRKALPRPKSGLYDCVCWFLQLGVLADSYVATAAREAGSAAEEAATRKTAKYLNIQVHHIFLPVAVESLGPINISGRAFLSKLGRKLVNQSGDDREISFLFQRLSVSIQRYNAILLHDCFVKEK